ADSFSYRAYDGALYGNTVSVTITVTPVEECPIVQTSLLDITVSEDAADSVINFSGTFLDPEGQALTYTVTQTNTSLLAATINTTSLTLNYTDNISGSATVTLTANDLNCGVITSESFLVTVNAVNDLPVGIADTIAVVEGGTVTMTTASATSVLSNDTDVEGETLTAGFILGQTVPTLTPNLGTLSFLDNGTFSYTHGGTQIPRTASATDTFFYRPYDGNGVLGNTTTVTIQISYTNDCPIVASKVTTKTVMEDAPDLDIDLGPVFTDEELNTITLTVSNTNTPLLTATLINTTTLTINFTDNLTGSSTITLYASDGVCSTLVSSSFVVDVVPQNDTPIGNPDIINLDEGGTATTTTESNTVLSNDSDPELDNLTATLVPDSGPFNHVGGAFSLQSSGTFVYIHDGSETSTDTFNYALSDGLTTTVVGVTINISPINDCPEVDSPIGFITVDEDAADTVINLSPNFSDAENDVLTFAVTNVDTSIATVTLNTNTLTIQYIPEQNGTTTVTISVDDLNGCSSVKDVFLVNITAINDAPVGTPDIINLDEGGTATTTTESNTVLSNDSDLDLDNLTATLVPGSGPFNHAGGAFSLQSSGTFVYIHDGSETSTDTFNYTLSDGVTTTLVSVTINISPINDCPVVDSPIGFITVNEDAADTVINLSPNFSDAENDVLTFAVTNDDTSIATVTLNTNILTIQYIPEQNGTTTVTISVDDLNGCSTVQDVFLVNITAVNDCPTLENQTLDVAADEDDPDLFIPLANIFEDIDTNPLNYTTTIGNSSIVATSITATALIIDFLPNQSGSTFINLVALDGDPNCTIDNVFTVSITPINDAPIGVGEVINLVSGDTTSILNDGVTSSVLANDSDPEGSAITAALLTASVNGSITLSTNGNFSYTHDGSATVTDSFTYRPSDGLIIGNTTTVTIYINNVPVGVPETIALIEGGTATTTTAASTSVLSNDTDVDSSTASLTATIGAPPLFGTLALNFNGSFTYTHSGSEDFTDSFTYIPFDGKGYGLPTVVSVTITPTNDAPVAFPDSITVGVGQTTSLLTGGLNSVLMNDIDPDGDSLTASLVSSPTGGTLVFLNPGGTFSYIQNGIMNNGDSFTYKANDGSLDSNTVTVNINLTCSPCTEKTIEAGSNGVIISYRGCDCRTYDVYVPKGRVFIFCHLDGSVVIGSGSYTVLSSKVCY
ncbi:Ig-like domain-containing protein, partial [Flavobacteriaceae bacterium]|nr:Ig-like domain-containing protein [Flavobacteriaceae bacterium]